MTNDASGIASQARTIQENTNPLAQIASSLLRAELARRLDEEDVRPECGSRALKGSYNTPLHVFALFLILFLSVLACSFPIVVRRFPRLPVPHRFLFLSRHFGTGVLIATAFVHLLPTAFVSLTDPCLPPFWNQGYPAMAGLVAMTAVLVVVGIEMFFAARGAGHSHDYGALEQDREAGRKLVPPRPGVDGAVRGAGQPSRSLSVRRFRQGSIGQYDYTKDEVPEETRSDAQMNGDSSVWAEPTSPPMYKKYGGDDDDEADHDSDLELDELEGLEDASKAVKSNPRSRPHLQTSMSQVNLLPHNGDHTLPPTDPTTTTTATTTTPPTIDPHSEQKELLQCLLLEAGILFHSVFIGMALSVATGTPFLVLLVAISFHQTFEGLALGSRIAAITAFGPSSVKPWLMALAYGTTTPAGQLLGLLIHNLYDPFSQTGLLMVGIMNAISSGLLLFAGLVELLAEDFLSDKSYEELRGRRRVQACASVVAGSLLMALVGAWA